MTKCSMFFLLFTLWQNAACALFQLLPLWQVAACLHWQNAAGFFSCHIWSTSLKVLSLYLLTIRWTMQATSSWHRPELYPKLPPLPSFIISTLATNIVHLIEWVNLSNECTEKNVAVLFVLYWLINLSSWNRFVIDV